MSLLDFPSCSHCHNYILLTRNVYSIIHCILTGWDWDTHFDETKLKPMPLNPLKRYAIDIKANY